MSNNVDIIGLIISYLLGSVPFAVIVGKLGGVGDITKQGSGNPGATNMARIGGKKLGAITLLLDALKGFAAAYLFGLLAGQQYMLWGGVAAIIGHCFSIFLKFKGGKGVATTLGVYFAINPLLGAVTVMIWLLVFAIFRISSVAALVALNLVPFFALYYYDQVTYAVITALGLFITWRHRSNIQKLLKGLET
jgi:acyl phosphate:glycerol-3-phosphate acyltransferase